MSAARTIVVLALALMAGSAPAVAQDRTEPPIDWNYAGQLYQKDRAHQPLTDQERAYLDRAKQQRQAQNRAATTQGGRPNAAMPPAPTTQQSSTGLLPLDQMTAADRYKGEDGGLYGGASNQPPAAHLAAAKAALAQVQKLDAAGKPAADGKIVLLSVGMSNTAQEFDRFLRQVQRDPEKSPDVVVVNGAQSSKDAGAWVSDSSPVWQGVEDRLANARVTAQQVQVIWLKQAVAGPGRFGDFPQSAQKLRDLLIQTMPLLVKHYPNCRVVYLSSRTYAGYARTALNPEPFAYEGAFAMRWVIQQQIQGELNFDPARGEVKSPVLLWGPYLWADGIKGRKSDGLTYEASDFAQDGTHPGIAGQEKVASLLRGFFKNELNAAWYTRPAPATAEPKP